MDSSSTSSPTTMDSSGSSEELNTSLESSFSETSEHLRRSTPNRPSPFTLRSQCGKANDCRCPQGAGIIFRSRISPSPSKQRVWPRRRRRSDQSPVSTSFNTTINTTSLDLSHDHQDSNTTTTTTTSLNVSHGVTLADDPRTPTPKLQRLVSGEMLRHRSRTPRRRKTTTASSDQSGGTPVSQEELGGGGVNGGLSGFAETLKKNVIDFITPTKEVLPAIVESSESGFEDGCLTGGTVPTSSPAQEKFIGAREFFAERDARDRLASDYYCHLDTPSKLRESTRRLSIRKPLNAYIAYSSDEELDEWQQQPRSDYTYSTSLTYRDRVTPDRKIGSPNMARRGLKGGNTGYVGSPDFSTSDLSIGTDDSSHLTLRTRAILRPMDVLSDTSDGEVEEVAELVSRPRRLRSSRSRSVDIVPKANGSTVTRTVTSSYTTTRVLHHGLDNESDADDGRESTVPQRATPLTARSGTPLARAATPITVNQPNSRSSVSIDRAIGGYTLAKGAIAEDVQEEETQNSSFVTWRKQSWQSITRITTLITTSLIMMVVRTVGAKHLDGSSEEASSEKRSRSSLLSTINTTRRRVTTTTTEFFASTRDAIRKKPILIWIPLLPLLVLLALVASWWLLQSGGETGDSADPTQITDGPSFLSYTLNSASQMTNLVINGAYYGPIMAWEAVLGLLSSVSSLCSSGLAALWGTLIGMVTWLGSVVHSGLAYILQTLSLALQSLQILFLAVVHLFSSSVSYVSGFFLPIITTNGTEQAAESEAQSGSVVTWTSSVASMDWASNAYEYVSEAAQASQTWLWKGWLWLIISVGDALSTAAASLLWLLGSLWSLLWFLLSGLWTVLIYIFSGIIGLFTSASTAVTYLAVETSSAVSNAAKLLFLPLFKSGSTKMDTSKVSISPEQAPSKAEVQTATVAGVPVEEVVRKVLESVELKTLITKVSSQSSTNSHLTNEAVSNLVMSVVEGELRSHKAETSALWETVQSRTNTATQETKDHISSLKKQQEDLFKQLSLLGAGLAKLQGSVEADQQGLHDHRRDYDLQLAALRNQIDQLTSQLEELESNHTILASEVKSCCRNASVTLADVEKHVTTLLGDILGLSGSSPDPASGEHGRAGVAWSAADMGAWLRSYFVAKEELEARLNTLMATKQKNNLEEKSMMEASVAANNAAMAQTTHTLMETVLEKLRAEIQQQHTQLADHSSEQVAQQVNEMKAAATMLGQQMSEQLENQFQSSKQQLQESVSAAVEDAVPKQLASAVPKVVASAVSEAVATTVPDAVASEVSGTVNIAVKDAVNEAVDAAVSVAVATAVPDAVNVAVPSVVAKVVANAVPEAVEEALPEAVNAVVHEAVAAEVQGAIAVAVPEVVASVLPSAVSTAVNETVESRISEVLVDQKVNKAGGGRIEVQGLGEEGVVVLSGTTSDKSSSGGATLSATVNVSKNGSAGSNHFAAMDIPLAPGLNESAVIRIVKEALLKYDADKTGMVDHALESAGGNIISTRCTESYQVHQAEVSILGFPIYRYSTNNPRTIIQPDRMPGQCWAFKGSQGYIVVQLAGSVRPTGFTLEHIPKSLSPSGEIDSAPREFEVWGLHSENDEGVLLGSYEYNQNGEPLQFFDVEEANTEYFPMIELKINSNHGNLQYTCLYRFRVHGLRYF